jgi:hypothetical protein
MAARKKTTAENNAVTFKVGAISYRVLAGQSRDFLSCKPKDGGWSIMDDAATAAVVARIEEQVARLKS